MSSTDVWPGLPHPAWTSGLLCDYLGSAVPFSPSIWGKAVKGLNQQSHYHVKILCISEPHFLYYSPSAPSLASIRSPLPHFPVTGFHSTGMKALETSGPSAWFSRTTCSSSELCTAIKWNGEPAPTQKCFSGLAKQAMHPGSAFCTTVIHFEEHVQKKSLSHTPPLSAAHPPRGSLCRQLKGKTTAYSLHLLITRDPGFP